MLLYGTGLVRGCFGTPGTRPGVYWRLPCNKLGGGYGADLHAFRAASPARRAPRWQAHIIGYQVAEERSYGPTEDIEAGVGA